MIHFYNYTLPNMACIRILEELDICNFLKKVHVYYEEREGGHKELSCGQAMIVYKMAKEREPCKAEHLYEFYNGNFLDDASEDTIKQAKVALTKMVHTINKLAGSGQNIIAQPSQGYYKFLGVEVNETASTEKRDAQSSHILRNVRWANGDIEGSYVGFYLDRNGEGLLKGMYLRIKEDSLGVLRAYAIHNLANLDILEKKNLSIDKMFESVAKDIHGASKLFHGVVKGYRDRAYIELEHSFAPQKINIVLDLSSYLYYKESERSDKPYDGGLTIQFVLWDTQANGETYASKIGFIRENKIHDTALSKEEITKFLALSPEQNPLEPLKINNKDDQKWYRWFTYTHNDFLESNCDIESNVQF